MSWATASDAGIDWLPPLPPRCEDSWWSERYHYTLALCQDCWTDWHATKPTVLWDKLQTLYCLHTYQCGRPTNHDINIMPSSSHSSCGRPTLGGGHFIHKMDRWTDSLQTLWPQSGASWAIPWTWRILSDNFPLNRRLDILYPTGNKILWQASHTKERSTIGIFFERVTCLSRHLIPNL